LKNKEKKVPKRAHPKKKKKIEKLFIYQFFWNRCLGSILLNTLKIRPLQILEKRVGQHLGGEPQESAKQHNQ
jgi:hypothetical protein